MDNTDAFGRPIPKNPYDLGLGAKGGGQPQLY
jgi:hypothetical protein